MKRTRNLLTALLLAVILLGAVNADAVGIPATDPGVVPYYTVISSLDGTLEISRSGRASCRASVDVSSLSYNVTLTCDLCKDGTVIKSWTASGKGSVSLDKSWYVTSGSDYQVVASATVYNSTGNYVDSGTAYSDVVSY